MDPNFNYHPNINHQMSGYHPYPRCAKIDPHLFSPVYKNHISTIISGFTPNLQTLQSEINATFTKRHLEKPWNTHIKQPFFNPMTFPVPPSIPPASPPRYTNSETPRWPSASAPKASKMPGLASSSMSRSWNAGGGAKNWGKSLQDGAP